MGSEATVLNGTVKWFDVKKGYGFVTDENGNDIFIHFSEIKDGRHYLGLNDGDKITFTVKDGKKGPEVADAELVRAKKDDPAKDDPSDDTAKTKAE